VRFRELDDGRPRDTNEKAWSDGTIALVFEPFDLIARIWARPRTWRDARATHRRHRRLVKTRSPDRAGSRTAKRLPYEQLQAGIESMRSMDPATIGPACNQNMAMFRKHGVC
jgi:hypothetical protein